MDTIFESKQCVKCRSFDIRFIRIRRNNIQEFICRQCNKIFSERSYTVFQNTQLSNELIYDIVRSFSDNYSVHQCHQILNERQQYKVAKETIRKFYQLFLLRLYQYTRKFIPTIIFEEEEVEIDETYFYRVKRGRGRGRISRIRYWVLGLISRQSKLKKKECSYSIDYEAYLRKLQDFYRLLECLYQYKSISSQISFRISQSKYSALLCQSFERICFYCRLKCSHQYHRKVVADFKELYKKILAQKEAEALLAQILV